MRDLEFNSKNKSALGYTVNSSLQKGNKVIITNPNNEFSACFLSEKLTETALNCFLFNFELNNGNGELLFQNLLEYNKIPYVYIGNGPFAIECSSFGSNEKKFHRVDFLVNIKGFGRVIFDLKCRKKLSFMILKQNTFQFLFQNWKN